MRGGRRQRQHRRGRQRRRHTGLPGGGIALHTGGSDCAACVSGGVALRAGGRRQPGLYTTPQNEGMWAGYPPRCPSGQCAPFVTASRIDVARAACGCRGQAPAGAAALGAPVPVRGGEGGRGGGGMKRRALPLIGPAVQLAPECPPPAACGLGVAPGDLIPGREARATGLTVQAGLAGCRTAQRRRDRANALCVA